MNHNSSPLVYIVILNWNRAAYTIQCLESIQNLTYKNFKVIICDNGSTDNSLIDIRHWLYDAQDESKQIKVIEYSLSDIKTRQLSFDSTFSHILIKNGSNLGYAGGNNVGLKYCLALNDFDYVWILNNDTVVDQDALMHLLHRSTGDSRIGLCGSVILYRHNPLIIQCIGGAKFNKRFGITTLLGHKMPISELDKVTNYEKNLDYICGASVLVSKKFLEEVGVMDEEFFLYYEEVDWAIRGSEKFIIATAIKSIVYHTEGGSIGAGSLRKKQSPVMAFYNSINRIRIIKKHFPHNIYWTRIGMFVSVLGRFLRSDYQSGSIIFMNIIGAKSLCRFIYRIHR